MLVGLLALGGLLVLLAMVLFAVAAFVRAEDAREQLRAVNRRLAVIEKQLGIARPQASPAVREARPAVKSEAAAIEERIAVVWFARVGAAVLVLGAAFFFFYGGVSGSWRLGSGLLFGTAALAFAEASRRSARPLFVQAVLGLGVAVLQFAAIASHALYRLAGPFPALAAAVAVLALGGLLSVRHRTQVPLVLPLAGALLAPALLWRDAALAPLLGYALAIGGAALAVSLRQAFAFAFWTALLGSGALASAWSIRVGGAWARRDLAALSLLAAAGLAAAWVGAAALARRPGRERIAPLPALVAALLLAHVPFAALLRGSAPLLAVACASLAVAGAWLVRREAGSAVLAAPLLLSGFFLAGAIDPMGSPAVATFVPLAAWGAAYARGLLRPGWLGLGLCGAAGVVFLVLAGELLAPHRWNAFGLVSVAWSVSYAALAMARRAPWLNAAAAVISFLGLAGAALPIHERGDPLLLAISGAWVLVHFGGLAFRIRRQHETPEWLHVATASFAGVAYGVHVAFLAPERPVLRGLLAALSAGGHLVLGALLLERWPQAGNALQAVAVGLFAVAATHALPGAVSTLAWAILAMLLVGAGFQRHTRLLRYLGLGLFAGTAGRVALYDVWRVRHGWEVAVLVAVGMLILLASYLYARLGAGAVGQERAAATPATGEQAARTGS